MKYKIIFDTSAIYSEESFNDFFGPRLDLQKFLETSEIIIPEMVIEEIKSQKRTYLNKQKNLFLENPFHSFMNVAKKETKDFNINKHVLDLYKNEGISHTVIRLASETAFEHIKKMALEHIPPFAKKGDRGFKDAHIYLTILEYLKKIEDEKVYLVISDIEFAEVFKSNWQVIIVKDYSEFAKDSGASFDEDYFIQQLGDYFEVPTEILSINQRWLNPENNWISEIGIDEDPETIIFVEVEFSTKEIKSHTDNEFHPYIKKLIDSSSYQETHECVFALKNYIKYFTYEQIHELLGASMNNGQIYRIAIDESIKEFLLELYQKNTIKLDARVDDDFKRVFNIEDAT